MVKKTEFSFLDELSFKCIVEVASYFQGCYIDMIYLLYATLKYVQNV